MMGKRRNWESELLFVKIDTGNIFFLAGPFARERMSGARTLRKICRPLAARFFLVWLEGMDNRGEARVGLPYAVAAKRGRKRWGKLQIFVIRTGRIHVTQLREIVGRIQNLGRNQQYILSEVD